MMAEFDLERYLGTWYEQGSTPMYFAKGCKNSKAEYSIIEKGVVKVLNSCERRGGVDTAEGRGYASNEPQKLRVGFFPKHYPLFRADYNIRYIEEDRCGDYRTAIVTSGDKVWFLTRNEKVSDAEYQRMLEKAKERGIPISKVKRTRQSLTPEEEMQKIEEYCPDDWKSDIKNMECKIVFRHGKHNRPVRIAVCEKKGKSIMLPIDRSDI